MIDQYGWSDGLRHDFAPHAAHGLQPGRVLVQRRDVWRIVTDAGELDARVSGRFRADADDGGHPVTGDWVAADLRPDEGQATIRALLPRRTAFLRWASGPAGGRQVVAANVDVAFLAASLNADLSLRRLERYLAMTYESAAEPVIVLTKADACPDVDARVAEVAAIAAGAPVLAVSARTGQGLDALSAHLPRGRTAVLVGSSGVGKSTLVNALAGAERMATQGVIAEGARGRHTTSHRELILLPSGGLILDTPGMRELGLFDADEGLATTFADLEVLAEGCRFSDCGHSNEPGCAVRAAVEAGDLDGERLESWRKLQKELAHERRREDPIARQAEQKRWAAIHKAGRARTREKRRGPDED
ncbi:ribosome small subunit-dependent GTPase A [Phenylobacterium sp. J367]|uniref:ribosome small subunit-dependent GTPase A n=1 Tax=Phenylobacterium sp. J367 TaxID=2898435 RepID=UPI002150EB02|nr:ribosome small subunit-dependent GTPase A [Phenylobacterium sp. J367]MCR5877097.1 ribosome small subunit-dependent GTPase A [Phenylobacterium sp. J367]